MEAVATRMKLIDYRTDLLKQLKDPVYAAQYLVQVLETGEQAAFLIAVRDVVEAMGGVGTIARQARIQRQGVYKALSCRGNPRLDTLQSILKPLGLRISVTAAG